MALRGVMEQGLLKRHLAFINQPIQTFIGLLRDEKFTFREPFEGFRFTRFDGSTVVI